VRAATEVADWRATAAGRFTNPSEYAVVVHDKYEFRFP
jgi:hypothetical protein